MKKVRLNIKPLSVNRAYKGRRFATEELSQYKKEVSMMLPKMKVPCGKLSVRYIFGVSSKNADGDNMVKALQDIISECYSFNDKIIYEWHIKKVDVQKGKEYIEFELSTY